MKKKQSIYAKHRTCPKGNMIRAIKSTQMKCHVAESDESTNDIFKLLNYKKTSRARLHTLIKMASLPVHDTEMLWFFHNSSREMG